MSDSGSSAADGGVSRPARQRRRRSATESLLSIVLGLEAVLVFFVMLAAFGLKVVSPGVAFGGGIALIVVLLLVGRVVRYPWGIALGWIMQAVLVATGIFLPVMYVIALAFVAIWIFCFVKGRQLDRGNATHPDPSSQSEETA